MSIPRSFQCDICKRRTFNNLEHDLAINAIHVSLLLVISRQNLRQVWKMDVAARVTGVINSPCGARNRLSAPSAAVLLKWASLDVRLLFMLLSAGQSLIIASEVV